MDSIIFLEISLCVRFSRDPVVESEMPGIVGFLP